MDDYTPRGPRQCFRCQAFGHLARDCTSTEKCKSCAGDHDSRKCPNKDDERTCRNCFGAHPTTFRGCPTYIQTKKNQTYAEHVAAQKDLPSPPVMDSLRLACVLSECIFACLRPSIQGIERETVDNLVAGAVSTVYKTRVSGSQIQNLISKIFID